MRNDGYHVSGVLVHRYPMLFTCCHFDTIAYCVSKASTGTGVDVGTDVKMCKRESVVPL